LYPVLLVTMTGLVIGVPWLTAAMARLSGRVLHGASPLLATRRLADDPKTAFRAVRALVLAVFVGTIVGVLVPTLESLVATPNSAALSGILLDPFAGLNGRTGGGLAPRVSAALTQGLRAIPGTAVFPLYSLPQAANPHYQGQYIGAVNCSVMRQLAVFGQCAPGVAAVRISDEQLVYGSNPRNTTKPFVSPASPAYTKSLSPLPLQAVLVRVNNPLTLERARTYLATHAPPQVPLGPGASPTPPRTFGETIAIRFKRAAVAQKLFDYAVALTILVAGCSLAVSVAGGLVDRKRAFTLLRVGGTPLGTLSRAVLLEAIIPLAAAVVAAAGIAYGMSATAVVRLAPPGTAIPALTSTYYHTLGAGLAIALAVIAATLPLLARITTPAGVRFE
jgi:hypothetical protein